IPRVVERMDRGPGKNLPRPLVVRVRPKLEVGVTERVYDQIARVPGGDAEEIERCDEIDAGEHAEIAEVEEQLLRKRKRDRRERAVDVTLVMLDVDPVQRLPMHESMRNIVPDFGPHERQRQCYEEAHRSPVGEKSDVYENGENDGVDGC